MASLIAQRKIVSSSSVRICVARCVPLEQKRFKITVGKVDHRSDGDKAKKVSTPGAATRPHMFWKPKAWAKVSLQDKTSMIWKLITTPQTQVGRKPKSTTMNKLKPANLVVNGMEFHPMNTWFLSRFLFKSGRIMPRSLTGLTAKQQRKLSKAIKLSRNMGLMRRDTQYHLGPMAPIPEDQGKINSLLPPGVVTIKYLNDKNQVVPPESLGLPPTGTGEAMDTGSGRSRSAFQPRKYESQMKGRGAAYSFTDVTKQINDDKEQEAQGETEGETGESTSTDAPASPSL